TPLADNPKGTLTPPEAIRHAKEQLGAILGWTVAGYEVKAEVYSEWYRELVKVYNRPTLQAFLKKSLGSDASKLPVIRTVSVPG
ncbi:hypothetical protein ABTL71_19360, partial [Acinetobacter baumannii]